MQIRTVTCTRIPTTQYVSKINKCFTEANTNSQLIQCFPTLYNQGTIPMVMIQWVAHCNYFNILVSLKSTTFTV